MALRGQGFLTRTIPMDICSEIIIISARAVTDMKRGMGYE